MRICLRCGHNWRPRKDDPPVQCPRCRSPYWDRERVNAGGENSTSDQRSATVSGPRKYGGQKSGSQQIRVEQLPGVGGISAPVEHGFDEGAGGDKEAIACPECHYLRGCHAKKCSLAKK
jgi:DNA-directed RNA polymerase subunit RPC12/RpoP